MSTTTKVFHRVACDGLLDGKACPERLTEGGDWWDSESVLLLLDQEDWLGVGFGVGTHHFCPKHWTHCERCDDRTPLAKLDKVTTRDKEVLSVCPDCGMALATDEVLVGGRDG